MSDTIEGFFSCRVDREKVFGNKKITLYQDMVNRWIVVYPEGSGSGKSMVALLFQNMGLQTAVPSNVDDLVVLKSANTFDKSNLVEKSPYLPKTFPKNVLTSEASVPAAYTVIEFIYTGDVLTMPWPWVGRGFVIACPEDLDVGVAATFEPKEPPEDYEPNPLSPIIKPLKEIPKLIAKAGKVVLWGGAGILLWQVFRGTQSVRKRLT